MLCRAAPGAVSRGLLPGWLCLPRHTSAVRFSAPSVPPYSLPEDVFMGIPAESLQRPCQMAL